MINAAGLKRSAFLGLAAVVVFAVSQAMGQQQFPHHAGALPVPLGVMVQAMFFGCLNALITIGVILVYRASRVINFAQPGFGAVAVVLFYELMTYEGWSYWLSVPLAVGAAAATGWATELFLIRRFFDKTRLVVTVVTIAAAGILTAVALAIPGWLHDTKPHPGLLKTPFTNRWKWAVGGAHFNGNHVVLLAVTVAILLAMTLFFKLSSVGIAVRAASENDDRASLLGINTRSLSSLVWTLAAALCGLAAVLQLTLAGNTAPSALGAALGTNVMLRVLFAAIVADMENIPTAVVASILLSIFESSVFFAYSQTAIVDAVILGLVIAVLLSRRKRLARAGESAAGTWAASEEIRPIPAELASLPTVRAGVRRVFIVGAVVLASLPWLLSPSQTGKASLFAIYGIIVVSIVVLTGWGGQISLGQFGFVAVGAIVGGALIDKAQWPFPVALLFGSLSGALVAVVLGLPALRIKGLYLAVTTMAFAVATSTVLLNPRYFGSILPGVVNRPKLGYVRFDDERAFYYLVLAALGFAVFAALGVRRSRTGRALIAMRDNERTAQALGINLVRTRLATFAISGFLAAFAGVLYACQQHAVHPEAFSPQQSIALFLMAIIGGLGSVPGALTGALLLGALEIMSSSPIVRLFATSGGVLFFLLVFPGGVGAGVYKLRDSILRRVAIRRRIYVPSLLGQYGMVGGQMARVPLAPKFADGATASAAVVPVRYRKKSRIGVAGASQADKSWSFYDA
jgi:branched-chain amino acid transport system permease protein